ncbi:hypothetical protein QWZ10_24865 [Paracoccus cavernae]|nr:hypothetical protein [Paracoccus cavernae]
MGGREIVGPRTFIEPEDRAIGFMFQDYALFPHLSVDDNLAFGLRHLSRAERDARVAEVAERISIGHLRGRFPHSLSGASSSAWPLPAPWRPSPRSC